MPETKTPSSRVWEPTETQQTRQATCHSGGQFCISVMQSKKWD